jgi:hypothetical protein
VAFSALGVEAPSHGLAVFGRIHVIPRFVDVGQVISEKELLIEVWNAFRWRARALTDITVEGPPGISVIDHLGIPADYPATDSQIYTVRVSAEGGPVIDNLVTWVFATIDPEGTNLTIVGFRLIPLSFQPNMESAIVERFGFLTDVQEAFDGTEQRRRLRRVPVGSISYSVLLLELRDVQMANAMLYGNQTRGFGVPRWQFQQPLTADALIGSFEVLVDTTYLPFEVGGLVFLWQSAYQWEAQTIAEVQADRLVLTTGLRNEWSAQKTRAVPMVVGRLSQEETIRWLNLMVGEQDLVFDIDGFRP